MKQIVQNLKNGQVDLIEIPVPHCGKGSVLIKNQFSLISTGTEKMLLEFGRGNWISKARQQPEKVKQVINKIKSDGLGSTIDTVLNKLDTPLPLGYSSSGVVIEVGEGVSDFKVGDKVISNGPHAEFVCVPQNLVAKIPEHVGLDQASFTVLGAIALQGIRLAKPSLGETFLVLGLGLIGQLTVQLLRANGCRVIVADLDPSKMDKAKEFGAIPAGSGPEDVSSTVNRETNGAGVDGVIITASTKSNGPIELAPQSCRKRGRVILVGSVGLNINRADFYDKEISFQVSCSYGPGRYDDEYEKKGMDYPIGFVRWTENRNFQAFLNLLAEEKINIPSLIERKVPLEKVASLYDQVAEGSTSYGLVVEYPQDCDVELKTVKIGEARTESQVVLGMIGAGSFASAHLISGFDKQGVQLKSIASASGVNGHHQGKKWGFTETTTDYLKMLEDPSINTVVVATRHDLHAEMALNALAKHKHVFMEKPLAINYQELESLESFFHANENAPRFMLGFNRRFSPLVQKLKDLIKGSSNNMFIYNINAGELPVDHWIVDPKRGGGRLIGECCHFLDLLRFLSGEKIESTQILGLPVQNRDIFSFSVKFENGHLGVVNYFSSGAKDYPKERLEVHSEGRTFVLDNFRKLTASGARGFRNIKLGRPDKGINSGVAAFVHSIKNKGPTPIPLDQIFEVSKNCLDLAERC